MWVDLGLDSMSLDSLLCKFSSHIPTHLFIQGFLEDVVTKQELAVQEGWGMIQVPSPMLGTCGVHR